jgi:hypothetical protein
MAGQWGKQKSSERCSGGGEQEANDSFESTACHEKESVLYFKRK